MFSRLSLRSAALGQVLARPDVRQRLMVAVTRASSSQSSINNHLENWEKANSIYYGPERDMKNFPVVKQPENTPPTRIGILPESWFTAFHSRTGVTGPYIFGAGLLTFVLSKELWIIEHGFTEFVTFWGAVVLLAKMLGPKIAATLDSEIDQFQEKYWDNPMKKAKSSAELTIAGMEKSMWQEEGQKFIFEAKRENVDLQLEAVYRQRLRDVHTAVKKRLDFQIHSEDAKRKFEQDHMVQWIVDSVKKGITPQQEKESLTQCIKDLKNLSTRYSGTATA